MLWITLRNKFIIGSGGDYSVSENGGNKEITLEEKYIPPHSHTKGTMRIYGSIISQDETGERLTYSDGITTTGAFKVSRVTKKTSGLAAGDGAAYDQFDFDTNFRPEAWTGETSVYGGVVVTDGDTGVVTRNVEKINILPPYYSLAYIMKIR